MIIAEIGINHNGDIELAKKMIKLSKEAGADIVKFQKRNPDICVPEEWKNVTRKTPNGIMTYLEYRHMLEFGKEEYDEIDRCCKEVGIRWTASVWDIDSLNFILQYDIPFIKIPSACITDIELLNKVKETNIPVVMSCGMSTVEEIERAIRVFGYKYDLTLMWCNSSYPARDDELDLRVIQLLKSVYRNYIKRVGYSSHEEGIGACIVAKTLGAEVIEKHVTLDKNMWGSDQKASITFDELKQLVNYIKKVDMWLGDYRIKCYPSEENVKKRLRRVL